MADEEEKKYPEEVPPEESSKPEEEIEQEMKTGEQEADVYSEEGREVLEEDDVITPKEEGFMEGAEGLGEDATCKQCEKILSNDEEGGVIAREIKGKRELFCSNKCADIYEKANP